MRKYNRHTRQLQRFLSAGDRIHATQPFPGADPLRLFWRVTTGDKRYVYNGKFSASAWKRFERLSRNAVNPLHVRWGLFDRSAYVMQGTTPISISFRNQLRLKRYFRDYAVVALSLDTTVPRTFFDRLHATRNSNAALGFAKLLPLRVGPYWMLADPANSISAEQDRNTVRWLDRNCPELRKR